MESCFNSELSWVSKVFRFSPLSVIGYWRAGLYFIIGACFISRGIQLLETWNGTLATSYIVEFPWSDITRNCLQHDKSRAFVRLKIHETRALSESMRHGLLLLIQVTLLCIKHHAIYENSMSKCIYGPCLLHGFDIGHIPVPYGILHGIYWTRPRPQIQSYDYTNHYIRHN